MDAVTSRTNTSCTGVDAFSLLTTTSDPWCWSKVNFYHVMFYDSELWIIYPYDELRSFNILLCQLWFAVFITDGGIHSTFGRLNTVQHFNTTSSLRYKPYGTYGTLLFAQMWVPAKWLMTKIRRNDFFYPYQVSNWCFFMFTVFLYFYITARSKFKQYYITYSYCTRT